MKKIELLKGIFPVVLAVASACEVVDNDMEKHVDTQNDSSYVALQEVASILSAVPLEGEHLYEVHSAVTSSSGNGYDEEYTVRDMFSVPGKGVGENQTRSTRIYDNPLKSLIENHVRSEAFTKSAGEARNAEDFLNALMSSDIQIYWPFSEDWDGSALPVITFDPEDGSEVNIGYRIEVDDDGSRRIREIAVDEDLARRNPVWVVNRNEDAEYTSLEILRREDENWGEGGGAIILEPQSVSPSAVRSKTDGGAGDEAGGKTLILKEFTMKRNYDSWFAGASEFFVKVGSVEDFTATTEAEMKLYVPAVTDFMIVVKRSQVGKPQPFNAVLVSDWTDQMLNCAFLITEDDGGTRTDWNCTALVRVASKSYGVEMKIPFNSRDDIVWRGQLAAKWLQANSNMVGHFGDVDLTFEVVEY
ncbi:MAG: hypothetical protein J6J25_08110 [Bacteroidales bacterium]|nr:hypothetical protein [Bacteroidales bacterium]